MRYSAAILEVPLMQFTLVVIHRTSRRTCRMVRARGLNDCTADDRAGRGGMVDLTETQVKEPLPIHPGRF